MAIFDFDIIVCLFHPLSAVIKKQHILRLRILSMLSTIYYQKR